MHTHTHSDTHMSISIKDIRYQDDKHGNHSFCFHYVKWYMVIIMYNLWRTLSEDLLVHFSRIMCSLLKLLEGSKWTLFPEINLGWGLHEIVALSTATAQAEKTLVVPADHLPRQRRGDGSPNRSKECRGISNFKHAESTEVQHPSLQWSRK